MTYRAPLLALALALGCNVELIEPESIAGASPRQRLGPLPQRPAQSDQGDPTARWTAAIRRNLAFLTDASLGGRRPGTEGARLTQSAIVSLFSDGGLIPSAPTLGWTSSVGIRTVQVVDPKLTVTMPVEGAEPELVEITEGLWLRHRGAAGTFHLPMEAVALAPQVQLADRLAVGIVPVMTEVVDPTSRFRGLFDALAHRGPGGCLLKLPSDQNPTLRSAAEGWSGVEVQPRLLGSEPPAGLPVEGFVDDAAFEVLTRAATTAGSKVDVSFTAQERWFEDNTVVGRFAGGRKPEQVVLVTANWDAGGLTEPTEDGGEAQSATGIAVLLAVAERIGRLRQEGGRIPVRSIVFVAGAAGSLDDLGLRQLAQQGIALPENIVAIVHLEDLDWTAPTLTVVGGQRSTVGELVRELLPLAQLTDHEPGYGHMAFQLSEVPRVTLTRRGGAAPQVLDPAAPLTNLATSARVAFDLVWELADAVETPAVILPRLDAPTAPAPEPEPAPTPPPEPAP